jgi:hydrogenase expression/formation protein HypC
MCLAVPGKVMECRDSGPSRIAKVRFGGVTRQVYLDFVPDAEVGDYVLVHVGFAISRIDEEEARRTYEALKEIGAILEMEEEQP